MFFYILLAFGIFGGCKIIEVVLGNNSKMTQAIFGGFILIILSSMRSIYTGADSLAYYTAFLRISQFSLSEAINSHIFKETGFTLFCYFLSFFSTSEHWLFFCSSLIAIFPIMLFIGKYSFDPALSWLLYILFHFFSFEMNIMRQSMAMGLVLIAYIFYFDKQIKFNSIFSIVFLILSILIHNSAICVIPLIILSHFIKQFSIKTYLILITSFCIFLSLIRRLITLLFNVGIVTANEIARVDTGSGFGRILIPVLVVFIYIIFKKNLFTYDKNSNFWEINNLFALVISISSFWMVGLARASLYFQITNIIMLPNIIKCQNLKGNRIILWFVIIGFHIFYFINGFDSNNYFNYIL